MSGMLLMLLRVSYLDCHKTGPIMNGPVNGHSSAFDIFISRSGFLPPNNSVTNNNADCDKRRSCSVANCQGKESMEDFIAGVLAHK